MGLESAALAPIDGKFLNRDILSLSQFCPDTIDLLFQHVPRMRQIAVDAKPCDELKGKLITLLFYESSSRTSGSFDAAMKQLGGNTIVIPNPQIYSSVAKGETLEDTIRTFEAYTDGIVLRHPQMGAALKAAIVAEHVPIINAGDGIGEHPTQALLDLYTIKEKHKRLSKLTGLFGGDILNGRTIHSVLEGLALYPDNKVYLLSPEQLKLKPDHKERLGDKGLCIYEIDEARHMPKNCDFWYWTRVQKERFASDEEYLAVNNRFIVTLGLLESYGNDKMILMHPLPRVGEIDIAVDNDPRAVYLKSQIRNGMYVRMALLSLVLGRSERRGV